MKPFATPGGWHEWKFVYLMVPVNLVPRGPFCHAPEKSVADHKDRGLFRFEICSHIKYRFFEESVTFVHYSVLEDLLCFWYLSREFDCRMKAVCLQEKFFYFVSVCVPHWYDFSNTSFPKDGCCVTSSQYFAFYFGHEYISKCYSHFRAHRCSMGLKKILSVKMNDKVPFSGLAHN